MKILLTFSSILLVTAAHAQQPTTLHKPFPVQQMAPADYGAAQPMPFPTSSRKPSSAQSGGSSLAAPASLGESGMSPGADGSGVQKPTKVPTSKMTAAAIALPQEFGNSEQPYTTARSNAQFDYTFNYYPYRPAGRLFFKIGRDTFVCSASLIKPGVVVTAAHCVANFGRQQFYSGWVFIPAYENGNAPYGVWSAQAVVVMTSYFNGSDSCAQKGIVCKDDVAVIVLGPQDLKLPGNATGWFGYAWGGYSFSNWMGSTQALITQLGYPVALDGGNRMERTDSQGFVDAPLSNNTVIGSLMTGGSSGGPWLVNFGLPPSTNGTSFGNSHHHNIVVGVTSWGYVDQNVKQEGAAPFTSGNIPLLVGTACGFSPSSC